MVAQSRRDQIAQEEQRKQEAVQAIQQFVKICTAKRLVREMRSLRASRKMTAILLQSLWRARCVRKRLEMERKVDRYDLHVMNEDEDD